MAEMLRTQCAKAVLEENNFLIGDLFVLPRKMSNVTRWSRWVAQGAEVEDVLSHTFTQSFLIILIVEMLREEGGVDDGEAYDALACTVVHDIGEADTGDILDYKKTRNDERYERRVVSDYFSRISEDLSHSLMRTYDVQDGAKDDEAVFKQKTATVIFGLAEKLCYLCYALRQAYRAEGASYGESVLTHVVDRQIYGVRARLSRLGLPETNFPVIAWAEQLSERVRKD